MAKSLVKSERAGIIILLFLQANEVTKEVFTHADISTINFYAGNHALVCTERGTTH